MSIDLEQRLEDDLAALADRTPWTAGDVARVRTRGKQRRHRRIALRATIVVGICVGTTGVISLRHDPPVEPTSGSVPSFRPEGRQVPLGRASRQPFDDALSHSRWSLIADDRFELALTLHVAFMDGDLIPTACVTVDISGVCTPLDPSTHDGVPAVVGNDALMAWTDVPPSAALVQFDDGVTHQWQRPVDGIVAFPVTDWHAVASLIARDANGNELGRADLSTLLSYGQTRVDNGTETATHEYYTSGPLFSMATDQPVSADAENTREKLATTLMAQCVGGHTALDVWWRCIDETNAKLDESPLGQPLPALAATTLHGQVISLADRAGHWLVLEFTSTTCQPCTDLLPALREFDRQQSQLEDGAELYSIETLGANDITVRSFYDSHPTTWPVLLDGDSAFAAAFGIDSIPEIWIVDALGNIIKRIDTPIDAIQLSAEVATVRGDGP